MTIIEKLIDDELEGSKVKDQVEKLVKLNTTDLFSTFCCLVLLCTVQPIIVTEISIKVIPSNNIILFAFIGHQVYQYLLSIYIVRKCSGKTE